ncbi:MAG: SUMF1/EgtB/PvdO family nonheme iron enzyme [Pseudanabaena sp.]|nr:SUMF1/EgtB/PvdO family nonheme iron enzyme [Pseudanabaena sp. M53BS1SP1A06MG]MCA6582230.1 SUMF1/EgtB/PvdO family nonheme iron enzyme [Pseudanabaena sp. M34BS1SP1A06MG]MCA6585260.1 SUMF1/EgtB/PvdO family nonheme iron enzyme [Pseudanabaena sp. M051S1SP1A06QC]MCA6589713.1 SUMF1/EgtB/PvdO family nonheme iron enzyme [Pseudanabaena sp. M109S1SP1A06QC]MCA6593205.1 SUMF1/EgtB/PvdO family nonheme iron enzyme [Pseudanabaena sp. M38BS1SP1A06MG]MCA6597343.1 SUMF1/EgtB/PvdO family nonheme iron enzyme [P
MGIHGSCSNSYLVVLSSLKILERVQIHSALRGGSWNNNANNCRSANRNRNDADNRNNNIGFRVVL